MRHVSVQSKTRRNGPTAFVLNLSHAGLGAIRSLGRAGVPVIGLDPDPSHLGFASRYCRAKLCPHPVYDQDQLADFLVNEGKRLAEPGILSPASDAFVLFLSRYRAVLHDYFRFSLPPPEVMEAVVNKRKLYELADRVGVPHATTFYPESMDDVHRIKHNLEYPVYIKPYYSHLWQVTFPGPNKGIKAFTPQELVSNFEYILPTGIQVMVQSIIAGPVTNVQSVRVYVNQAGDLSAAFTNRKIRQIPPEFGQATLAESIHNSALCELGTNFFRDSQYRGFGLVEFKRDDRDGRLKITDLNPRWLKTVNLATDSGIDFPLMHYLDLAGQMPAPQWTYKAGVRWLDATGDFASAWPAMRSGELSPWAWVRSWLGARSFAVFAMDDWGPFLKEYRYGLRALRAPLHMWRGWRSAAKPATRPATER